MFYFSIILTKVFLTYEIKIINVIFNEYEYEIIKLVKSNFKQKYNIFSIYTCIKIK
mgnify:CR=1 FL=1|jgi:hypothetical protein